MRGPNLRGHAKGPVATLRGFYGLRAVAFEGFGVWGFGFRVKGFWHVGL